MFSKITKLIVDLTCGQWITKESTYETCKSFSVASRSSLTCSGRWFEFQSLALKYLNFKITGVNLNLNEQLFPFDDTLAKELLQRFPNNVFVIIVICTVNQSIPSFYSSFDCSLVQFRQGPKSLFYKQKLPRISYLGLLVKEKPSLVLSFGAFQVPKPTLGIFLPSLSVTNSLII